MDDSDTPELKDDGVRKGELGFSLISKPHDQISLGTLVDVWRNFHKLLTAIDKEVASRPFDWKIVHVGLAQEGDCQKIELRVKATYFAGAKAEQLFVDLMALLKEKRANG